MPEDAEDMPFAAALRRTKRRLNMIYLSASKAQLIPKNNELLTSGAVQAFRVRFAFSSEWRDLIKTAVFRAGETSVSVLLDSMGICDIPWEVLEVPNQILYAGVYGIKDGEVVLPSVWASLGTIQPGVEPPEIKRVPTPSVYEKLLAEIGNLEDLKTADRNSLVAAINEIVGTSGGGGNVSSAQINTIEVLDQSAYDALESKNPSTLYLIRG